MKNFRNWLIHKLGGYTKEDGIKIPTQFTLSESKREVKRIISVKTFTPRMIDIPEAYKDDLKKSLLDDLTNEFNKTYNPKLKCRYDVVKHVFEYSIMLEYLEPEIESE